MARSKPRPNGTLGRTPVLRGLRFRVVSWSSLSSLLPTATRSSSSVRTGRPRARTKSAHSIWSGSALLPRGTARSVGSADRHRYIASKNAGLEACGATQSTPLETRAGASRFGGASRGIFQTELIQVARTSQESSASNNSLRRYWLGCKKITPECPHLLVGEE